MLNEGIDEEFKRKVHNEGNGEKFKIEVHNKANNEEIKRKSAQWREWWWGGLSVTQYSKP